MTLLSGFLIHLVLFQAGLTFAVQKEVFKIKFIKFERELESGGGGGRRGKAALAAENTVKAITTQPPPIFVELPQFDRADVEKTADNFDFFLFLAKASRCNSTNQIIDLYHDRYYYGQKLTRDQIDKISTTVLKKFGNSLYVSEAYEIGLSTFLMMLYNLYGPYFADHIDLGIKFDPNDKSDF